MLSSAAPTASVWPSSMNTVAGFSPMILSIASASACNCGIWSGETSHEPLEKLMVLMSTLRT